MERTPKRLPTVAHIYPVLCDDVVMLCALSFCLCNVILRNFFLSNSFAESILDVSENVRPFRHIMFEAEEEV